MPTRSKVYRVMIGSPSDLSEERLVACAAVNDWNAQRADAESAVLLPVMWETHAMPASGVRPQAAINDQLVDRCDILFGMFWTKLGTSTGVAASGTVEEIGSSRLASRRCCISPNEEQGKKRSIPSRRPRQWLNLLLQKVYLTCYLLRDVVQPKKNGRTGHVRNDGAMGLRRIWTISHGRLDHPRHCRLGRGGLAPTIRFFVTRAARLCCAPPPQTQRNGMSRRGKPWRLLRVFAYLTPQLRRYRCRASVLAAISFGLRRLAKGRPRIIDAAAYG
jgi:hypothetical protein